MATRPKHRDRLIHSAVALFRKQGYAATGINDILAAAGAPKGSFYHYFPNGKEQLGEAAVRHAGERVLDTLRDLRRQHGNSADALRAYGELLAGWMAQSGFADGCPLATTLLETTPASRLITDAGREAIQNWRREWEALLIDDGIQADRARPLASLILAALEGALVQARVECHGQAIADACASLADQINALRP